MSDEVFKFSFNDPEKGLTNFIFKNHGTYALIYYIFECNIMENPNEIWTDWIALPFDRVNKQVIWKFDTWQIPLSSQCIEYVNNTINKYYKNVYFW